MKKIIMTTLLISGSIFAQSNTMENITISNNNGDVIINQKNNYNLKEQEEIAKKLEKDELKFQSINNSIDKTTLLDINKKAREINRENITLDNKNEKCKLQAKIKFKAYSLFNLKLALSYCNNRFKKKRK